MVDAHTTGKDRRAAGTGTGEAARLFLAWLAADANPALTKIIQAWLWQPGCGGPGVLPVSAWDVARLRAEILAAWPPAPASRAPERRPRAGSPQAEPASPGDPGAACARRPAAPGTHDSRPRPEIVKECWWCLPSSRLS